MKELKKCPFCGGEAVIKGKSETFQIIGCKILSMLCPNPSIVVYKNGGEYDYSPWNNRTSIAIISELEELIKEKSWAFADGYSSKDIIYVEQIQKLIDENSND